MRSGEEKKMNEDEEKRVKSLAIDTRGLGELACIAARHAEEIAKEANSLVEEKFIIDTMAMIIEDKITLAYLCKNYVMLSKK